MTVRFFILLPGHYVPFAAANLLHKTVTLDAVERYYIHVDHGDKIIYGRGALSQKSHYLTIGLAKCYTAYVTFKEQCALRGNLHRWLYATLIYLFTLNTVHVNLQQNKFSTIIHSVGVSFYDLRSVITTKCA